MGFERFKSDDEIERWFEKELEKGNFTPVENFEEVKRALQKAAERALRRKRFIVELPRGESSEKFLSLLKEHFGEGVKVEEL